MKTILTSDLPSVTKHYLWKQRPGLTLKQASVDLFGARKADKNTRLVGGMPSARRRPPFGPQRWLPPWPRPGEDQHQTQSKRACPPPTAWFRGFFMANINISWTMAPDLDMRDTPLSAKPSARLCRQPGQAGNRHPSAIHPELVPWQFRRPSQPQQLVWVAKLAQVSTVCPKACQQVLQKRVMRSSCQRFWTQASVVGQVASCRRVPNMSCVAGITILTDHVAPCFSPESFLRRTQPPRDNAESVARDLNGRQPTSTPRHGVSSSPDDSLQVTRPGLASQVPTKIGDSACRKPGRFRM